MGHDFQQNQQALIDECSFSLLSICGKENVEVLALICHFANSGCRTVCNNFRLVMKCF